MTKLIGYMIVGPWEDPNVKLSMGLSTISKGPAEAWRKHTQGQMDKVQAWFNKGYRLRRVMIKLIKEPNDS